MTTFSSICLLEEDQQNEPNKKKIEALFDKYPTLQSWLNE